MPVQRVIRAVATALAVMVVIGTGVAWNNVRSFEDGIFHMSAPSLGKGGDDGAIDILLVGLDSRTDAHGNPLSAEELAALKAGDEEATNTDTIILIRIPNNGKSATAISIPRDSYVSAPGLGKTKINGVYGATREAKRVSLVKAGDSAEDAAAQGTEAGRDALIKTVAEACLNADIATTTSSLGIGDIAAAAGLGTGTVYRLIGSKDELLASIMESFGNKAGGGFASVLRTDATPVEKLDALSWVNINALDQFPDEWKIQLAWMRQSPPDTPNPGLAFTMRLRQLRTLLSEGIESGDIRIEDSPSLSMLARYVMDALWVPENIVRAQGKHAALLNARDTLVRGAAERDTSASI